MSGELDENQLGNCEIVEAKLYDIKGYWDMSGEYNYNDREMWEGQLILYNDGWFEGIVNDPHSPYTGDRFIFGNYLEDKAIELWKLTPIKVSNPFIYRGQRDNKGYDGDFAEIGLFGERIMGVSHLITQVAKEQDNISQLIAKIENFKQCMDSDSQDLYGKTSIQKIMTKVF